MTSQTQCFIEDEVERQGFIRGTASFWSRVGGMMAAWNHARTVKGSLTPKIIQLWGMMIEPHLNSDGWRKCGVRVGSRNCPDWREVPRLMAAWAESYTNLTPDEAYVEFEGIHPFIDGNGRTGKIIHNWLLGTLENPVLIKDYFGGGLP